MPSTVVTQLPHVFHALVPELRTFQFPPETRATCSSCAMAPKPDQTDFERPYAFTSKQRCCTYIPGLANWQVGRILRRGDRGARKMLERLNDLEAVSAAGVGPRKEQAERYAQRADTDYGRMDDHVCPYWVDEPLACTIWQDRNAICRTWHCKSVNGLAGWRTWNAMRVLIHDIEYAVQKWVAGKCDPPDHTTATKEDWILFFLRCAARVDAMTPTEAKECRYANLDAQVADIRTRIAERDNPMPSVLSVVVRHFEKRPEGFAFYAYTAFDEKVLPPWIFTFFSKLDGKKPWRAALAEAEQELGQRIGEPLVRELWSMGILQTPPAIDWKPGAHPLESPVIPR